jgi:hypothetical protein
MMAKSRKKRKPAADDGVTFIYVHFPRVPEESLDIHFAIEDLVGDDGEVRSSREGPDGQFSSAGEAWGYEVLLHDPETVDQWADRLIAGPPAILEELGEHQLPWLEVVFEGRDDTRKVLRRIDT